MTEAQLIATYPLLWHVAVDGSWPAVQCRGLLSTSALLDAYGAEGPSRHAIECAQRPRSVTLRAEGLPDAVIRDQRPMSDAALRRCLQDGLQPTDWYRTLNSKVFFWLSRKRLERLLGARGNRDMPHTVLTVDTASLVNAHRNKILLSPMNSGSTIRSAQPRGKSTFLPVADYPFEAWKARRGSDDAVVELVIEGGVPDIADHVLTVHGVTRGTATEIWHRPSADTGETPFQTILSGAPS
jgi:hypothetical protein